MGWDMITAKFHTGWQLGLSDIVMDSMLKSLENLGYVRLWEIMCP